MTGGARRSRASALIKEADPDGLDGNVRRAIDIHDGDSIDGKALKALIRPAVALNMSGSR